MSEATCETCRFWLKDKKYEDMGICRRHAPSPQILHDEQDEENRWPIYPLTTVWDWCGEHEPTQPAVETVIERSAAGGYDPPAPPTAKAKPPAPPGPPSPPKD
ncbi:MAG: hypothetical protein VW362_02415 [Candidatus Nanopelagicales bacterium]